MDKFDQNDSHHPRSMWYGIAYQAQGPIEGDLEEIALAAITYHKGLRECSCSAPTNMYESAFQYAVHYQGKSESFVKSYDVLKREDDGGYSYLSTVNICDLWRESCSGALEAEFQSARAIIYDKRVTLLESHRLSPHRDLAQKRF